jgi:indolepyruvate ferredoxin oxidoreductase beta subunit
MSGTPRPLTIQIAALGGEGGGVLTSWIVDAAAKLGCPAQSTSIPGVAQRTGATSYYIEMIPRPARELDDRAPVLSLYPGLGDVDLMVASELLEAGRAIAAGHVTPDRTLVVASTHRIFAIAEKMAMDDGRLDVGRLMKAIEEHAQASILFDMEEVAKQAGSTLNAVLLGAIVGSGRLPIPAELFEEAIREEGKAVDANLRGFRAGLERSRQAAPAGIAPPTAKRAQSTVPALASLEQKARTTMPATATDIVVEGLRRLTAYQDLAYAGRYLERLQPIRAADEQAGAGGRLLRETARHLAVRMSFEDVIRVAQAKTSPARLERIRKEMGIAPKDPMRLVEFFKPGVEEICSLLPPSLARPILALAARRGWMEKLYWGMEIRTSSITGFFRLWLLARLRRWRPRSYRFVMEQAAIDGWLALILEAAPLSPELALEVAECARLIKGYGDTHRRGTANWRRIETAIIAPALAGRIGRAMATDAVANARTAALADPEGEQLGRTLAHIGQANANAAAETERAH